MALENIEYGSKASSEVLNNNFNYLDEKITTTNQKLETVDSQIQSAISSSKSSTDASISSLNTTLTNTLNSKVTSLQNSINSVKSTANGKLSASKGSYWVKFSNNLIVQWGEYTRDKKDYGTYTYTFPTPFTGTSYSIAASATYQQYAGDKGSSFAIITKNKTNFTYRNGFEQAGGTVRWIAIGF